MQAGDNRQMALILKQYKHKTGEINYPAVFTVPSIERLPALYEKDFMQATALVVGAITMAFEKMRFKNMDGKLLNDIAEEVLDTSGEDNLSLEDLVLFLQGMVRGKYGVMENMSVSKFMKLFDEYRLERTNAICEFRLNEHLQFKGMGDSTRMNQPDPLAEHFSNMGARIAEMKNALSEKKQIETIKKADQYFANK